MPTVWWCLFLIIILVSVFRVQWSIWLLSLLLLYTSCPHPTHVINFVQNIFLVYLSLKNKKERKYNPGFFFEDTHALIITIVISWNPGNGLLPSSLPFCDQTHGFWGAKVTFEQTWIDLLSASRKVHRCVTSWLKAFSFLTSIRL